MRGFSTAGGRRFSCRADSTLSGSSDDLGRRLPHVRPRAVSRLWLCTATRPRLRPATSNGTQAIDPGVRPAARLMPGRWETAQSGRRSAAPVPTADANFSDNSLGPNSPGPSAIGSATAITIGMAAEIIVLPRFDNGWCNPVCSCRGGCQACSYNLGEGNGGYGCGPGGCSGGGCGSGGCGGDNCGCGNFGGWGPRGPIYVRGEYLGWWLRGDNVPALVTTSRGGHAAAPGRRLGSIGTTVLFGGGGINNAMRSGGSRWDGGSIPRRASRSSSSAWETPTPASTNRQAAPDPGPAIPQSSERGPGRQCARLSRSIVRQHFGARAEQFSGRPAFLPRETCRASVAARTVNRVGTFSTASATCGWPRT